jgi:hypothetical protein
MISSVPSAQHAAQKTEGQAGSATLQSTTETPAFCRLCNRLETKSLQFQAYQSTHPVHGTISLIDCSAEAR